MRRRIAGALVVVFLLGQGGWTAAQEDPPQQPEKQQQKEETEEEKAARAVEEERKRQEAEAEKAAKKAEQEKKDDEAATEVKAQRAAEIESIEAAAQDRWLQKWKRWRQSSRDITEWNLRDGMFRMRFGIRVQTDLTIENESDDLTDVDASIEESLKFRRARLFADGDFLRRFHYRFEYDFSADNGLKDAYVDNLFRHKLKHLAFRMGHFKEPFSLERHASANYNAFMEWALPVQTFAPGRNLGIAAYGHHRQVRLGWTVGAFTDVSDAGDNSSASNLTLTARMTGLPVYRDEGRKLLHLGLSLSLRDPANNTVSYATRPEARFTPFFIGTGDLPAKSNLLGNIEVAMVNGPFWMQAELLAARPVVEEMGARIFGGAYVEVGGFLTGESRPYRRRDGTFGRLEPLRPYRLGGNPFKHDTPGGALEFTGRLSYIDLNDGPVRGGRMLDLTLGANWYLTRASRVMINYVRSRVDGLGYANIVLIRYQFNPGYHWPPLDPRWRHKEPEAAAPDSDLSPGG